MFDEIKQHNALVRDQIYKGVFGGEELLEKAHNEGDVHPNGKWVWTKLPNGKYDWRVIKKKKQITIHDLSQSELDSAVKIIEKQNPDSYDGKTRIIGMSDDELKKFRIVAEYFIYGGNLKPSTRVRVRKWVNLAVDQLEERKRDAEVNQKKS